MMQIISPYYYEKLVNNLQTAVLQILDNKDISLTTCQLIHPGLCEWPLMGKQILFYNMTMAVIWVLRCKKYLNKQADPAGAFSYINIQCGNIKHSDLAVSMVSS